MPKGILYVMTTVVPGLIKIGKTGSDNFDSRMYNLERNGYSNVVGLKRHFAIEVDDYDAKEILLDEIFSKSRLENTELFALDVNLVVALLSSLDGKQIYPENTTKDEEFVQASDARGAAKVPDGIYSLRRKIKAWGNKEAVGKMCVKNGKFIVMKGSVICPVAGKGLPSYKQIDAKRNTAKIEGNILQEDTEFNSPSLAAVFVTNASANGWDAWKTDDGKSINIYRKP